MTIDEAIENLTDFVTEKREVPYDDLLESSQLSIEALKEIKHLHETQVLDDDELLPGETKE